MSYKFSEDELRSIAKLPTKIAKLAYKYPIDIINVAESWSAPPYPENYIPEIIEIFYGENEESDILIHNGQLKEFNPRNLDENMPLIAVQIDGQWAYIQIEGEEVINRLDNVILPSVLLDPSILVKSILKE
jgi:hypothetical protein